METLPPIEVNQDNILIDGYHRWKAHETAKAETIPCTVTETESEAQLLMLAVSRNAKHGQQLTTEEKKRYCILWFDQLDADDICNTLSIGKRTYRNWTSAKREALEEQTNAQIQAMYLQCHTQQQIADAVDLSQPQVTAKIDEIIGNGNFADSDIFHDFEGSTTDSTRQIYTIWNISKANEAVTPYRSPPIESTTQLIADTPPGGRCFAWGDTATIRVDRNPARFKLNGRRIARAKLEAMIQAKRQAIYR